MKFYLISYSGITQLGPKRLYQDVQSYTVYSIKTVLATTFGIKQVLNKAWTVRDTVCLSFQLSVTVTGCFVAALCGRAVGRLMHQIKCEHGSKQLSTVMVSLWRSVLSKSFSGAPELHQRTYLICSLIYWALRGWSETQRKTLNPCILRFNFVLNKSRAERLSAGVFTLLYSSVVKFVWTPLFSLFELNQSRVMKICENKLQVVHLQNDSRV